MRALFLGAIRLTLEMLREEGESVAEVARDLDLTETAFDR